eukprot:gnl/TRDRNA2_/TRDRNA2_186794_c0_seq1.p1 gnl/TRDRNA2_/TRDRNA2_186794_c0~~gnl/TRDRNA2_/TRDRNA2_186794_c0_seq1.p1  ORF type:complete len:308 (-),score=42.12 gnl/TRDRNA2_/TRDRNA2_186794_c0_seq1:60-875(-)
MSGGDRSYMQWLSGALACAALLASPVAAEHMQVRGGGAMYTDNSACIPSYCINPIVPGLEYFGESFLGMQETRNWRCVNEDQGSDKPIKDSEPSHQLWQLAGFCKRAIVQYPYAVADPPEGVTGTMAGMIEAQAREAMATYAAHIAGMGLDVWDYQAPWEADDCIKNVWLMSCYTSFPRCNRVEPAKYLRPCKSTCENYLEACHVECCDEGVQCVFTHEREKDDGSFVTETGYVDHHGPSPLCTGAAVRGAAGANLFFLAAVLAALAWPWS